MDGWWRQAVLLVRQVMRFWPRRLVVRATGEPVELMRIEAREGVPEELVLRRADGSELRLAEAAVTSRLVWNGFAAILSLGIAAAAIVAGLTMDAASGQHLLSQLTACVQAVPVAE
jgi:hypothetical protein